LVAPSNGERLRVRAQDCDGLRKATSERGTTGNRWHYRRAQQFDSSVHITTVCQDMGRIPDGWRLAAADRPNNVRHGQRRDERSKKYVTERNMVRDINTV